MGGSTHGVVHTRKKEGIMGCSADTGTCCAAEGTHRIAPGSTGPDETREGVSDAPVAQDPRPAPHYRVSYCEVRETDTPPSDAARTAAARSSMRRPMVTPTTHSDTNTMAAGSIPSTQKELNRTAACSAQAA